MTHDEQMCQEFARLANTFAQDANIAKPVVDNLANPTRTEFARLARHLAAAERAALLRGWRGPLTTASVARALGTVADEA